MNSTTRNRYLSPTSVLPRRSARSAAHPTLTLLAYGAIYFLWGSTFFAMRVGINPFQPLLVPAMRHLTVGLVFYPVFRFLSKEKPPHLVGHLRF